MEETEVIDVEASREGQPSVDDISDDPAIKLPYYLENFLWIVQNTLKDSSFQHVFDGNPAFSSTVQSFENLDTSLQRLYVRLFLRKHVWIKRERMRYETEFGGSDVLNDLLKSLVDAGFLERNLPRTSLEQLLDMLSLPQLKDLSKSFKVGTSVSSREEIVKQLMKKVKEQRTPFGVPLREIIYRKAADMLTDIYRVEPKQRQVFLHFLSLFQTTAGFSNIIGQNPIFGLLQLNIGNLTFPTFKVHFDDKLFSSLEAFLSFEAARQALDEAFTAFEGGSYEKGKALYYRTFPVWEKIVEDEKLSKEMQALPPYKRRFSAGYHYTKVLEIGLECLERLGDKSDALNGFMQLLDQEVYVPHHRGKWYNRVTILLLRLDKRPDASAKMLLRGIRDPCLRPYQRLELCDRLRRMMKQVSAATKKEVDKCQEAKMTVKKGATVQICGRLCPTEKMGKGKTTFLTHDVDTLVTSVEELALENYRKQDFLEGVHDEGALFRCLYGIFFWDVIYCETVPNVFRSKFQAAPLDLACSSFFASRETVINTKLKDMSELTVDALVDLAKETWDSHKDKYIALINWDRFKSFDHLAGFVRCFSPKQLAKLMERYATDYGAVRSGFPDLTVWNSESRKLKVIEVKGPNDRLSHKQLIWIDFLMDVGIDVEVCHVVATGSKKLKRSLSTNSNDDDS